MSALDLNLLPTFLAVLDSGRISAAAKHLHLSQPAVTSQIHKLEEALGVPLFVRSAQGVSPTEAGERFATHARAVQRQLEEAVSAVRAKEEPLRTLSITASTTIAAHVLPPVLARFRAAHPFVPFRVAVANTEDVLDAVKGGRVPIGLVEGHGRAAGVRLEPYVDDALVPVMGRGAGFRIRHVADLERVPILWREPGSGTRAILERPLRRAGIRKKPLPIDIELASTEAILGAAAAGLGVAFVSRWSVQPYLAIGTVQIVAGLDFVLPRTFYWALPAGGLHGTEARFYDFARRNPPLVTG
jgi:DNA-binding transcriptional LysR family regulator